MSMIQAFPRKLFSAPVVSNSGKWRAGLSPTPKQCHSQEREMLGKIKFLDNKTQKWGFIVPDDGTRDLHFHASNFDGDKPTPAIKVAKSSSNLKKTIPTVTPFVSLF